MTEVRVVDPVTGGAKGSKPARFDLIPPDVLWELATHYGLGEEKYPSPEPGVMNWQLGYNYSLSYAALQRHLFQWSQGEDFDPETGSHHLIAVMWHATCLRWFQAHGKGNDDISGRVHAARDLAAPEWAEWVGPGGTVSQRVDLTGVVERVTGENVPWSFVSDVPVDDPEAFGVAIMEEGMKANEAAAEHEDELAQSKRQVRRLEYLLADERRVVARLRCLLDQAKEHVNEYKRVDPIRTVDNP